MPAPSPSRLFSAFLIVAVCALCVLVLLLLGQNRRLRADNESLAQALLREQTRGSLGPGEVLEPLTAFDREGRDITLDFAADRPTLVLMTSGDCPHCSDTLPLWDRLLTQTDAAASGAARIVLLQVDADRPDQLKPAPASMSPLGVRNAATSWLRKFPISPAALWADRTATVRRAWHGVPSARDLGEMAECLLGGHP